MKKRNKYSIFLFIFLSFFIFHSNCLARQTDIELDKDVLEEEYNNADDLYDLDYEPESTDNNVKVWDPWEKVNRKIFNFNSFLLKYLVKPLYYNVYVKITTPGIRKSIHNVVSNFRMPIIFINYVLQLDFENSARTLYSFGVNTIYGVFGILDVSGYQGTTPPTTDLGITLAKYHIPSGPYIVLPFLGPSDLRGTLTWGTELAVDPLDYNILKIGGKRPLLDNWILFTRSGLYILDNSSYAVVNFYDIMESSFDPYIMMRNAYGQSQSYKIKKVRGN